MKKKKFILPVFLFILSLIFCGGITQYSTVSVKAATTTKKQTGFVMKMVAGIIMTKTAKKLPDGIRVLPEINIILEKQGQQRPEFLQSVEKNTVLTPKEKCLPGGRQSMERPISLMRKKDICTLAGLPQQLEINTISGMTEQ